MPVVAARQATILAGRPISASTLPFESSLSSRLGMLSLALPSLATHSVWSGAIAMPSGS